jgi:hypothetical protein
MPARPLTLIAAGMVILAGDGRGLPFDDDELERWTRVGYERGVRSRKVSAESAPMPPAGEDQKPPEPKLPGALSNPATC